MGSSSSSRPVDPANKVKAADARKRRYRNAVTVIGTFSKHTNQARKEQKRLELIMAIEEIKKQNNADYEEALRYNDDPLRFRQQSAGREKEIEELPPGVVVSETDKPPWAAYDCDLKCWLCSKQADEDAHPCRVCTRTFHQHCLDSSGLCRKVDAQLAHRSRSNIGWSCYVCGNLNILLTEAELEELIERFEDYDADKDGAISWEDFSRFHFRLVEVMEERQVTDVDQRRIRMDFKVADVDNDGKLDWWEFINHGAKRILAKRDKKDLVELLTQKELLVARALFRTLDKNGDGSVTELEAREAYRDWYRHFEDDNMGRQIGRESSSLELHVTLNTKMMMERDMCDREVITWPSFLLEQCLYLICNRPNIRYTK